MEEIKQKRGTYFLESTKGEINKSQKDGKEKRGIYSLERSKGEIN
jgi:hypothetical protein